jgi:hypothetical protein
MSVYKVQCVAGHIVTVQSESDDFQFCASESDCGAVVITVSQQVSI